MSEQNGASTAGGPTLMSTLTTGEIENFLESDRRVFPEHLFKSVWLPIFAGVTDEINGKKVSISDWLDVAGTAMHDVDIVDKEGKVLFSVPSLIRDTPMMSKRHANDTMREVMSEYVNYASLHPNMGKVFMEKVMFSKIPRKPADVRYIRRWNEIFSRYGYPPIELSPIAKQAMTAIEKFEASKQQHTQEAKVALPTSNEIDYDDEEDSF